ncbi:hypothetical protein BLS_006763 [Venturia inaequalis]|uniref:non-specific serine/threonine protein kinase n=1 Tax=Venturia inaequalis TaxID=5025 RepID=A0A8H3YN21_VENIN|nr:hypothetical protein BLS_006763 [Venturia inaequalis]
MENSNIPFFQREETISRPNVYEDGIFFEIHVGDTYQERYIVLQKLGYGMSSTVWLVHDAFKNRYFAMKVLSTECYGNGYDFFELEILEHLRENQPDHPGQPYVSKLVDSFTKETSIGITLFLVFEVMAETLHSFIQSRRIHPAKIIKRFAKQLLLALDHAHKSGVVHTDIKADNVMIQLPDQNIIKDEVLDPVEPWTSKAMGDTELDFLYWPNDNSERMRREHGIEYKFTKTIMSIQHTSAGMEGYYLDDDVCEEELLKLNVSFCDWGLATWTHEHLYETISTPTMRSPEVLLGAPWDTKTDIWSLGILIFEMLSGFNAFDCVKNETQYRYLTEEEREDLDLERQQERDRRWREHQEMPQADDEKIEFRRCENRYDLGVHLNEIATMIEPFPQSLLGQVDYTKENNWYLKSLFSNDGTIWGYDEYNRAPLEYHFPQMPEGQDKDNFLIFLWKMMRVDPKDRASAEELLQEPWLQDVVLDDEGTTPSIPLRTPRPTPWSGDELKQPYCEPIYPGDKIVDPLDSDKEGITPPTPLPTPPPKHDHEGTYCDFTDTLHEIVDPLDCDSASDTSSDCSHSTHSDTSAHTNSTTLNLDYLIDLVAREDISKTDSDDDTVADMEVEISTTCTNALTRVDSRISDPNDGFVVDMDVGTSDTCTGPTTLILDPLDDIFADVNDFVADIGVETTTTPTTLIPEPLYDNVAQPDINIAVADMGVETTTTPTMPIPESLYDNVAQPDINIAPINKKSAPVAESTKTSSRSQKKTKSNTGKKNKNKNKKNKKGKRAAKR